MPLLGPDITLNDPAYIDETARLHGKVTIGQDASIWPQVVIRSERHSVTIGERTNIQDFVMVHEGLYHPTAIGADCSITHHCTIHGCTIGDRVLIGINATVMDGAVIGDNSIVAGQAIVVEGSEFSANSVIAGVPARKVAERDNSVANLFNARYYRRLAQAYAAGEYRIDEAEMEGLLQGYVPPGRPGT